MKNSQKEVEKLKADLIGLETKFKWNNVKLKQEIEAKFTAEKRVEELTQEVSQLKMNEIAKAKEEIEVERNMLAGELKSHSFLFFMLPIVSQCSNKLINLVFIFQKNN